MKEILKEIYAIVMVVIFFSIIVFILSFFMKLYDQDLRNCYFQEPRSKECEYRLWKHATTAHYSTTIINSHR